MYPCKGGEGSPGRRGKERAKSTRRPRYGGEGKASARTWWRIKCRGNTCGVGEDRGRRATQRAWRTESSAGSYSRSVCLHDDKLLPLVSRAIYIVQSSSSTKVTEGNEMQRRITILLVASALVASAASHSDVLKCYMCTSLSEKDCGSAMTTSSLEPVECTMNKMGEFQGKMHQHRVLNSIANLFAVDTVQHYQTTTPRDMNCAKMVLNVANQEVIVRTCQTAKTEHVDPCKTMEGKMQVNQLGKMEQCSLCVKDACNGTTALSPEIFYTLLSFLGALIHVAFYHWA